MLLPSLSSGLRRSGGTVPRRILNLAMLRSHDLKLGTTKPCLLPPSGRGSEVAPGEEGTGGCIQAQEARGCAHL